MRGKRLCCECASHRASWQAHNFLQESWRDARSLDAPNLVLIRHFLSSCCSHFPASNRVKSEGRDLPQKRKVKDVKMKFSCETCLKNGKLKMWENEVLMRDLPQKRKVKDVKTTLSCETSLNWEMKLWQSLLWQPLLWHSKIPVTIPVTSIAVTSNDP